MKRPIPAVCLALTFFCCGHSEPEQSQDAGPDPGSDAQNQTGWTAIADVGGGPIQETGVTALDGKLYLVGGFTETLQLSSRLQVYDPGSDRWTLAAPLPEPMHHVNFAAVGDKLYVLGGMNVEGLSFRAIGSSYEYDPATDSWRAVSSMPMGTERGSAAVGVIDGLVYLAGGLRNGATSEFSSYDPQRDSWDLSLPALPQTTDHLAGAAVGDQFFAIGGRSGGIGSVRATVLRYSPGDVEWTQVADMPTARGGMASGVLNSQIIVVGGEGNSASPSGVFASVESYDPQSDLWTRLPDMVLPRHGMGAAAIGDILYVPGGADVQGFGAVARADAYRRP